MKVILLALLLISATEFARGSGSDSSATTPNCEDPHGDCKKNGTGSPREIWLANFSDHSCYRALTNSCSGIGFTKMSECLFWCISVD
uniref:Putative secreted peptide n=1 Tax=Hyalomma excavatum TaxID=257692 RepID=A0A131XNB3_9ACAR